MLEAMEAVVQDDYVLDQVQEAIEAVVRMTKCWRREIKIIRYDV